MKILAYGFPLDSNFGGPSVAHGFFAALKELFPDCELVVYQQRAIDPVSVSDMPFPVRFFPYQRQAKRLCWDWLRYSVLGRECKDVVAARFWADFRSADVVVNIYAICFCARLAGKGFKRTFRESFNKCVHDFLPSLLARFSGKLSLKTTSSYGPISSCGDGVSAGLSSRLFFKRMLAREARSRDQLAACAFARRLAVAPDLANLMPVKEDGQDRRGTIALSVSFMSERQWGATTASYVECMRELTRHIYKTTGSRILFVPNQINIPGGRDDIVLSNEIIDGLPEIHGLSVFDVRSQGSMALKGALSACEAVVSCRYHTCVAALSAGVPVLVVGWHYKYEELMKLYQQGEWMLSSEDCSAANLRERFDDFWSRRAAIRQALAAIIPEVRRKTLASVGYLFSGKAEECG